MASNDPTDTGGLFIGRRPGTAPVRFPDLPADVSRRGSDATACSPTACWRSSCVLCLSLFGPQPAAWLWVGSQVQYLTGLRDRRDLARSCSAASPR